MKCERCNGTGNLTTTCPCWGDNSGCPDCHGTGEFVSIYDDCPKCHGTGKLNYKSNIPPCDNAEFNRFDICDAWYLFARHYHVGGDTSDRIFGRLNLMAFKPGFDLRKYDDPILALSFNAQIIYQHLVKYHPDAQPA